MKRRKFIKSVGLVTAAAYIGTNASAGENGKKLSSGIESNAVPEFPPLPFAYNALEPYIDARTMEIHYDKHHRAYYTNFITAIKGTPLESMTLTDIFTGISKQSDAIRNNAGGLYNHTFFWNNLIAPGSAGPSSDLTAALTKTFGSVEKFREAFNTAAKTRFGSGWAWFYMNSDKTLAIGSSPNQDNPLMDISPVKGTPLLALDVWEHAYYLKYQNKRPEYIDAFWNVVNWNEVSNRYQAALKG
jgi:superoxide dismutase, Fe-Mn family